MSWFSKLISSKIRLTSNKKKRDIPEGLWSKCLNCTSFLFKNELQHNLNVCPKCSYHMRISARSRIKYFLDSGGQLELGVNFKSSDRLKFKDVKRYKDRLSSAIKKTGESDALLVMRGTLKKLPLIVAAFEFGFIGGSMGAVVGQKFILAVNECIDKNIPLVCFSCSGGARMQESLFSLMQMARTAAALKKLSHNGLPYISVLVDPCTGGVSASLAMLGDINISEPGALIGFAGPRVIEQTVGEKLPDKFQTSEFVKSKGFIDMIVDRREHRDRVYSILSKL